MREKSDHINSFRVRHGKFGSDDSYGMTGMFLIPKNGRTLRVISDSTDQFSGIWEHVSVSLTGGKGRLPNWGEMSFIKELFFGENETVVQFHPKKSEYVDIAPVLHLWRRKDAEYELPPGIYV